MGLKTLQIETDFPEIPPPVTAIGTSSNLSYTVSYFRDFVSSYRDRDFKKSLEAPPVPLSLADKFPTPHNRGFSMDLIQGYTVSTYKQTLLYLHKACIQKSEECESQSL